MSKKFISIVAITILAQSATADLTIYTDRVTANLKPLTDQFTNVTGDKVNIVELAYPALKTKIEEDGDQSPVDLIFVKDLVYLNELAQLGFFQKFTTEVPTLVVPAQMQNSDKLWLALTYRARTLIYNKTTVNADRINDYKDLANSEWAGRLCLRTSQHPYNQALVANILKEYGAEQTTSLIKGLVENLAQAPMASDRAVIDAIAQGQCDIGLVNHYYLAPYVDANPAFVVAPKFLKMGNSGVHTNGSGLGIYKNSRNLTAANAFIDFMLEDQNQLAWSKSHFDYPVKRNLLPTTVIQNWGAFDINLSLWQDLSPLMPEANQIIKDAQYK